MAFSGCAGDGQEKSKSGAAEVIVGLDDLGGLFQPLIL